MSFDPTVSTPEMTIEVSLGQFHRTHDRARAAQKKVQSDMSAMNTAEMETALTDLRAGQRLTDAEDGADFMYADNYNQEIRLVRQAISGKNQ